MVNNKATLEDIEFHFNNAKIISKKTVPLYETILKNNSKTEQANDFNFETEVKTWSEWKQNGGELLINKTKIKFRKPFFKNGSLCYANLELIDADLQKKEGIIEKTKIKVETRFNIAAGDSSKLSLYYQEIEIEIPWIGLVKTNLEKIQISGVWKGILIEALETLLE